MTPPFISVVMPVYNGEKFLAEAIDSILNQTFTDFEFLIIDDGSNDGTFDLINKYSKKDSRVRVYHHERNSGIVHSLNKGVKLAKCSLIARMDADDVAFPNRLQVQYEFMQYNPEISVCGSYLQVYEEPKKIWKCPLTHEAIIVMMLFECCLYHPTVIFRKAALLKEKSIYDEHFLGAEDYELWQRLSGNNTVHFANIPEPLLIYRVHPDVDRMIYKDKQQKLANIIRIKQLKKLGFNFDELTYSLHEAFSYGEIPSFQLADLSHYQQWLNDIEKANNIHSIYSTSHLKQEFNRRWLKLCLQVAFQHPLVAIKFLLSRWSPMSLNSFYLAIRMLWQSRKSWGKCSE